jgi:predicted thioesterase
LDRSIEVGTQASVSRIVTPADLASSLSTNHEDQFPDVFATARMVALMELAAARVLKPVLMEGELSVGVTVNVSHSAPTALGETVTATATYLGREGKLFAFEVKAEDSAGEVGRGTHNRAIISTSRLLDGAQRRKASQPGAALPPS